MSYESTDDKDLELKLRLMNILWNMGWFVRPNVKIQRYQEGKRTSGMHTDIDVLGIKVTPLENPIITVCSAKSGKESDSGQIFWLGGVKSYFGATSAYYVRTHASLRDSKALCQKLDIISLNEEQIRIMEERLSLAAQSSYPFDLALYKQIHEFMDELKEKKIGLYNYITEKYWIDPTNNQLLRIITAIRDAAQLSLTPQCSVFAKYYLSSMLALPLLRIVHSLLTTPTNLMRTELETALMGGEIARLEKEKTLQRMKSILAEAKKEVDLEAEFRVLSGEMYDLVVSFVDHYSQSIYVPRMLDALTHQIVKGRETIPRIEKATLPDLNSNDWKYAAKLSKDVLVFMQRVGGLTKAEVAA